MDQARKVLTTSIGVLCILPEVQAFCALLIPVSLVMFFFVKFPLWLAMFTFLPLYCLILTVFIDLAGLREFLKAHKRRWSWREAIITALAFFPIPMDSWLWRSASSVSLCPRSIELGENCSSWTASRSRWSKNVGDVSTQAYLSLVDI